MFFLRAKYHKLKYGTELNQGDLKMPTFESGKNLFIVFSSHSFVHLLYQNKSLQSILFCIVIKIGFHFIHKSYMIFFKFS